MRGNQNVILSSAGFNQQGPRNLPFPSFSVCWKDEIKVWNTHKDHWRPPESAAWDTAAGSCAGPEEKRSPVNTSSSPQHGTQTLQRHTDAKLKWYSLLPGHFKKLINLPLNIYIYNLFILNAVQVTYPCFLPAGSTTCMLNTQAN